MTATTRREAPSVAFPIARLLLFALPTLACLGSWLPVAGPFFGFRVAVLILLPIAFLVARSVGVDRTSVRAVAALSVLWLLVGGLLWLRVGDRQLGLRELLSVAVGLACVLSITLLARYTEGIRAHEAGWALAIIVVLSVALLEIVTDHHLPGYFEGVDPSRIPARMPASFLGNPNNLAAFLVLTAPLLLRWATRAGWTRWGSLALAAAGYLTIYFTGGRIALGALALGVVAVPVVARRLRRLPVALVAAVAVVLLAALPSYIDFGTLSPASQSRSNQFNPGAISSDLGDPSATSAAGSRIDVYKRAIQMTASSKGLGVGPGQFGPKVRELAAADTATVVQSPHNFYLQVLAEYGVVIFLAVLAWLIFLALRGYRLSDPRTPQPWRGRAGTALLTLVVLSVACIAPADFLVGSVQWVILGVCAAFACRGAAEAAE